MNNLSQLHPGERAVVHTMSLPGELQTRLRDLGLVSGTAVQCRLIAPSGSPMAFEICGALIALRRTDAARIFCIKEDEA